MFSTRSFVPLESLLQDWSVKPLKIHGSRRARTSQETRVVVWEQGLVESLETVRPRNDWRKHEVLLFSS